jgi:hypothetical protein
MDFLIVLGTNIAVSANRTHIANDQRLHPFFVQLPLKKGNSFSEESKNVLSRSTPDEGKKSYQGSS